jgi:hypothetical protein
VTDKRWLTTYVRDGSSYQRLGERWNVSKATAWRRVQRTLTSIPPGTLVAYPNVLASTVVMLDGKHFRIGKRPHTLYVIQDGKNGRPFAWILLPHQETRIGYDALLDWTANQGYQIEAVVSDGHKGLAASVHDHYPNAVHQRCAAHVLRTVLTKLGGRWFMGMSERRELWREISFAVLSHAHKTDALNDLARLTKSMPTYLRVKWANALSVIMVTLPGLYAFEQRPDLGIPRTSNRMEALMGSLQQRLKTCRGFENPETLTSLVSMLLAEKIPTNK